MESLNNQIEAAGTSSIEMTDQRTYSNESLQMTKRKQIIPWTFEEDVLFFELHRLRERKNEWAKYEIYFIKSKTAKEIKNHFHTCITKSVKRIIGNIYDSNIEFVNNSLYADDLIDIMRCFYSLNYLNSLINEMSSYTIDQMKKIKKHKYHFNPQILIKKKKLSLAILNDYKMKLIKNALFQNSYVNEVLKENKKSSKYIINNVYSLFFVIAKQNLFRQSIDLLKSDKIKDKKDIEILHQYVDNF